MARVTIEDCRKHIPNRFELVILAAQRAKDLSLGMPSLIQKTRDKDPVLALREIAAGRIDCDKLRDLVMSKYMDPMKKIGSGNNKPNIDLEDIFKNLATAISPDMIEMKPEDEYEIENFVEEDDCCKHISDEECVREEEDEEDCIPKLKQQQLDVDVTFTDEDVED